MNKGIIISITILFLGVAFSSLTQGIVIEKSNQLISDGNTLYVGGIGPNNYTNIQDAIDDAVDGDTVFVYDDKSPYNENIVVNKSINLYGENQETTIIDSTSWREIVSISADLVNIRLWIS